jgi:hypothetical protein
MHPAQRSGAESYVFEATMPASKKSGMFGYAIRVLPRESEYINALSTNLVKWAGNGSNGH